MLSNIFIFISMSAIFTFIYSFVFFCRNYMPCHINKIISVFSFSPPIRHFHVKNVIFCVQSFKKAKCTFFAGK